MGRRTGRVGPAISSFSLASALLLIFAVLLSLVSAPAPARAADDDPQTSQSFSGFPILMYDSDIGFGYGGKVKFVNYFRRRESLDLVAFNSTKGERWYVFALSIPDTEIRQGTRYGLSFDLRAEYDKYVVYNFYGIGPGSEKDDITSASYLKEELGLTFGLGFSPAFILEGAYILRNYKTFNVEPDRPFTSLLDAEGRKFSPYLSLTFRYDTSNSQIHPTRGVRFLFENDFAGRAVGNNAGKYYRMTLDLRSYTRLFFPKAVLAVRGLIQHVSGPNIPLWELSTLGGGSTMTAMRGYALNRFMDNGKFLAAAEYRFPIWKRIGGNIFAEGGQVWPSWSAISLRKAAFDAGWGLRYYLTNFVARFDMGFSREGTGIYFNFGHLF
ncbi:MAG: BamA/TamA family outer membrane protein [Candidatus Aminicenantales bacterium]